MHSLDKCQTKNIQVGGKFHTLDVRDALPDTLANIPESSLANTQSDAFAAFTPSHLANFDLGSDKLCFRHKIHI
jgi:hypothetical protein